MDPRELPVYQQKERILEALKDHQVIVVESPTGSGKTTQLPIILHEAGFSKNGLIGVTQPRRIAALSVSDFIARQLGVKVSGLVGYKMRFEDKTSDSTAIKIMTDGILLQEMKLDPSLSRYGVIMVDEAHERSLNIDFILGLLKRVLDSRPEFKVIVSSATINAEVFSEYFGECPIVKIETSMFPVTLVYDPPTADGALEDFRVAADAMQAKIEQIVARIVSEKREGDILIFLPGEKAIKDCMKRLAFGQVGGKLHIIPLYSRLGKDEQERVFERFFRVDKARSRATGGTGLGLAIVKHVAANHNGGIRLWSQPGTGSTFTLSIPAYPETNDDAADQEARDEEAVPQ